MSFKILLHPKAKEFLEKVDEKSKRRFKNKIKELMSHADKGKRLKYSNFWSLRVGDYRVIYEVDEEKKRVIILFIGHRKNVYDDFSKLF